MINILAELTCPALIDPPATPQQGWAVLADIGETFGPCLGRELYYSEAVAFSSCSMVKAGMLHDVSVSNNVMTFKGALDFTDVTASQAFLAVQLVFSHSVAASKFQMDHVTVTQGVRANIVMLEVNVQAVVALASKYVTFIAEHPYDGIEICFHDAVCYDDPDDIVSAFDTRESTFNPTDAVTHKFNYLSKVKYRCGELTAFELTSSSHLDELEVVCKASASSGTNGEWMRTDNSVAFTTFPTCICKCFAAKYKKAAAIAMQ